MKNPIDTFKFLITAIVPNETNFRLMKMKTNEVVAERKTVETVHEN